MNNPFKLIFLIINLLPSVAPTNNFSQPLPETELKVGQNSSKIVNQGEPIPLVGGTMVQGVWMNSKHQTLQRSCTLSFPVKNGGGRLGFLTSYACSNTDYFVKNDYGNLIEVGGVLLPRKFDPSLGLDYRFVLVYDGYWEKSQSENILYSSQCGESELLPATPFTDQYIYFKQEVCAFGGSKSEMVCGELLHSHTTIQVPVPGSGGEEFANFSDVVKVNMTKDYDLGYMGAPVYIPVQVPNSTQFIANPVGQVVETLQQYKGTAQDKKIWYYIPLDRILKDSGLELLSSDFASSATEFSKVSLSNDSVAEPSVLDTNPVRRQPDQRQIVHIHAGLEVRISSPDIQLFNTAKQCTFGFAVRKVPGKAHSDHKFLTLGSCLTSDQQGNNDDVFYVQPTQNLNEPEGIKLGTVGYLVYDRTTGLNFALVSLLPNKNQYNLWGWILIPQGYVRVIAQRFFPKVGTPVCFEGGYSGHVCGTVTVKDARIAMINPWLWESYIRQNALGSSLVESWKNLIKVRLNDTPRAYTDGVDYDQGSPVYSPFYDDAGHITKVWPVGILFDYGMEIEENGDKCEAVFYMYFVSIYRILLHHPELQLIGTNDH